MEIVVGYSSYFGVFHATHLVSFFSVQNILTDEKLTFVLTKRSPLYVLFFREIVKIYCTNFFSRTNIWGVMVHQTT